MIGMRELQQLKTVMNLQNGHAILAGREVLLKINAKKELILDFQEVMSILPSMQVPSTNQVRRQTYQSIHVCEPNDASDVFQHGCRGDFITDNLDCPCSPSRCILCNSSVAVMG